MYTTFITPFGRFHFNRLPFGIASAPEHFQRMMAEVIEGLEGVVCHIDDLLVWGRDQEEHDARLHGVLQRLEKAGITLNVDKCELSTSEVTCTEKLLARASYTHSEGRLIAERHKARYTCCHEERCVSKTA